MDMNSWLKAAVFVLVFVKLSTAFAQLQIQGLDTDWKRVGQQTWVRTINGFAGSAEITVTVRHGQVWYMVETPCVQSADIKKTLIWRSGEESGSEHSCDNERGKSAFTKDWELVAGPLPTEAQRLIVKIGIPI